jgi:hypothetical protein
MTDKEERDLALEEDDFDDAEELAEIIEEKIITEDIKPTRRLDYTLETPQERNELVKKIIDETPPEQLTSRYIEILTDYIIFAMDKEERKRKKILTDNRMVTVNKRETSFEGLVCKLENGEDGIYNMIANDKNIIFTISYVKNKEYWIGNMVFSPKMLEEVTEPIAELNVTDVLIERIKNGE